MKGPAPFHGETIRRAFRPVNNLLYFAGEHVMPENFGTMEGTAKSGQIAANALLSKST
jgi:monoamine oxidase